MCACKLLHVLYMFVYERSGLSVSLSTCLSLCQACLYSTCLFFFVTVCLCLGSVRALGYISVLGTGRSNWPPHCLRPHASHRGHPPAGKEPTSGLPYKYQNERNGHYVFMSGNFKFDTYQTGQLVEWDSRNRNACRSTTIITPSY